MDASSVAARQRLIATLDDEPHAAVLLDDDWRITHVNAEWDRSALEHHAPQLHSTQVLGTSFLSWIKGPMRAHAADALRRASADPTQSVTFESECNTPQLHQRLTSRFVRLDAPHSGLLLHFFLRVAGPLSQRYQLTERSIQSFADSSGLVTQCSCCRRARNPQTGKWFLSLELFTPGTNITHGLCESCLETYYPNFTS